MNKINELLEGNMDLDKILQTRSDLEKYIEIIDEYVITSKTDLKGTITYASNAFARISGYTKEELIDKPHKILRHPDMPKEIFKNMWETIQKRETWSGEIKNLKKDGSYYWVTVRISPTYDIHGNHIGFTSIRQDITDKKRIEELALTDELTGLYNRRHYNNVITEEIHRACRDEKVFSFIMLDIDNFKKYNDNYGHNKGDDVLKFIGRYLQQNLKRATDLSFRIGGEEFITVYSTNKRSESIDLANKLCKGIENLQIEHQFNDDISSYVTASLGLVICDFTSKIDKSITEEKIYIAADKALYQAKELGRNQIKVIQLS